MTAGPVLRPVHEASPTTAKYLRADLSTLVDRLWPLEEFHATRRHVQALIARRVQEDMAGLVASLSRDPSSAPWTPSGWLPHDRVPAAMVWAPSRQYLRRDEVGILAQASTDPERKRSLCGYNDAGELVHYVLTDDLRPLAAMIHAHALQLAVLAGYRPPAFLHLFWSAFALIAPTTAKAALVDEVPLLAPLVYHWPDGTATVDADPRPNRPKALRDDLDALTTTLAVGQVERPDIAFTPTGRRARTGYYADRETFLADARAVVPTKPRERRAFTREKLRKALGFDRATLYRYLAGFDVDFERDICGA